MEEIRTDITDLRSLKLNVKLREILNQEILHRSFNVPP